MNLPTRLLALFLFGLAPWSARAAAPEIHTIVLGLSNVHVIRGERTALVDTGARTDLDALETGLRDRGLSWTDVSVVILTHVHADHAGLAAEIRRRSGATLIMGAGDVPTARRGHHGELQPTNLTARFLQRYVIDPSFEPFEPDVAVDDTLDLRPHGIPGLARQLPGHTPGSLVVELEDGRAFVGDMMLGGIMGGRLFAGRAGEHYFQADVERNHRNIATLAGRPIELFYLGHGGPVTRESVQRAFGR